MKIEFETSMPLVTHEAHNNLLCFNEETTTRQPMEGDNTSEAKTFYLYDTARVPAGADYPTLVSCIIRSRYTADEVEAIVLNHGDGNPDHEAEYIALQEWRTEAKRIAKEVL